MPIDLYGSINKTSQWAFGSPILNSIFGSCIFVAITTALIMILLIMVMYPAKSGTSFSIIIKMFIYMLFCSMLVIFLHDSVIKAQFNEQNEEDTATAFMRNTTIEGRQNDPSYGSTYKPITPTPAPAPIVAAPIVKNDPPETGVVSIVEGGSVTGGRLQGQRVLRKETNPFSIR